MTSQPIEINNCSTHIAQYIKKKQAVRRGGGCRGGGAQRGLQHFQSSLLMCPFLLISPLNMLFPKKVTENVHENQEATF